MDRNTKHRKRYAKMPQEKKDNLWDVFAAEHQLELDEILAFLPESAYTYNALIFYEYGVEKQFSWYHSFHVYSIMKNEWI